MSGTGIDSDGTADRQRNAVLIGGTGKMLRPAGLSVLDESLATFRSLCERRASAVPIGQQDLRTHHC